MDSFTVFVICSVIMIFAGMIQGVTGFGFSLIMLPLMSLFIPIKELIPISVICSIPINLMVLYHARRELSINRTALMIIFGILAIPLGVWILKYSSREVLMGIIGACIIITAIARLFGLRVSIRNEKLSYSIVGALSGVLNGCVSLSGPPIVLFFSNQGINKDAQRGNFSLYAFTTNIFVVLSMVFAGLMNYGSFSVSLSYYPPVIGGVLVGLYVTKHINESLFSKITLYLLCFVGAWSIINAVR